MARIQPVLTETELALVDQMVALTGSKRTEVIKTALTVYHWFVQQALIGSVLQEPPTREERALGHLSYAQYQFFRFGTGSVPTIQEFLASFALRAGLPNQAASIIQTYNINRHLPSCGLHCIRASSISA